MQRNVDGNGSDEEAIDGVLTRTDRLLEYMEAVLALRERPVRDLQHYKEKIHWVHELPSDPACQLMEAGSDIWLRVSKVLLPPPPPIPPDLVGYVADAASVDDPPTLVEQPSADDPDGVPGYSTAIDTAESSRLADSFNQWIAAAWQPWAESTREARHVRRLYRELYDLYLRLKRDEASFEFVWGHGLLSWQVASESVRHPIITTRVSISFDEVSGDLIVAPEDATLVEIEFLQGLEIGGMPFLIDLQRRFEEAPSDPWDVDEATQLYEEFITRLPVAGRVSNSHELGPVSSTPTLAPSSMFFVRRRKTMYRAFLAALRERLDGPNGLLTGPLASVVTSSPSELRMPDDDTLLDDWSAAGEELLLPLPTNAEQEQIVLRLAKHRGVTVQGPPGTGKTHTIANLISHLVAHGKRVLVTSHKEQALAVLRDKIPPEIRDLSVAVLGSTRHSQAQLEQSVQSIYSNAVGIDPAQKTAELAELKRRLGKAQADVARLRTDLRNIQASELLTYQLGEEHLTPSEIGRWLAARSESAGFISDPIEPGVPLPLTHQDLSLFYELAAAIEERDAVAAARVLPSPSEFPRGSALASKNARRLEIIDLLDELPIDNDDIDRFRAAGVDAVRETSSGLRDQSQALARLEDPWLVQLRSEIQQASLWRQSWHDNRDAIKKGLAEIAIWRGELSGRQITLPFETLPSAELLETLEQLRLRRTTGKSVSKLLHRREYEASRQFSVDGEPLRDAASVELVLTECRLRRRRAELLLRYNAEAGRIGGPTVASEVSAEFDLAARMALVEEAFSWVEGEPTVRATLESFFSALPQTLNSAYLDTCAKLLGRAEGVFELQEIEASTATLTDQLGSEASAPNASSLWAELRDGLTEGDWRRWDETLDEAQRLILVRPGAERLRSLAGTLAAVAPSWAGTIRSSRGNPELCGSLVQIDEAWAFAQADTWLKKLVSQGDPVQLQRRLEGTLAEVSRLSVSTTAASAWLALAESLTDVQRSSLVAWVASLKKVGKGTGKYASHWRSVAQKEMRAAVGAVPVWIMPTYRVVESIDPRLLDAFDVLIVDEASQSDLIAISLLGIARKAVIVGDDKQISPQSFMHQGSVHQLQAQYLDGIPSQDLLDVTSSLYDTAKRVFPGVVMLKEHFRCLPEIIQFSNDLSYDGRILPLRERPPELADWDPVVDFLVADGYRDAGTQTNLPEAQAIARTISDLCHDPRYQDKSMGVISLLGQEQARLIEELVIEDLGEREFERRRLRSGDAYHFQGDERDVMFLSLVVAAGDASRGVMSKESDRQRINVAASRARDQMWVFRSLAPSDLSVGDLRGQLIRYAMNPHRVVEEFEDLAELCESDFERDVLRKLLARGFSVSVQHRVGAYRIDMVVKGLRNRIAIECDGDAYHGPDRWDADRQRQEVLERLGWKFFRVRGSVFYRDQEGALEPLWARLQELGIDPWSEESAPPRSAPYATNDNVLGGAPHLDGVEPTVVASTPRYGTVPRAEQPQRPETAASIPLNGADLASGPAAEPPDRPVEPVELVEAATPPGPELRETDPPSSPSSQVDPQVLRSSLDPAGEPSAQTTALGDETGDRDWVVDGFQHGDRDKIAGEVAIHKGKVRVHLRHMARLGSKGDWFWTRRGIAFDPELLAAVIDAVGEAWTADEDKVVFRAPLGSDEIRVGSSLYKSVRYVFVRRFYLHGKTWLPTQKGVSVAVEEAPLLLDLARRIQDKCLELGINT